MVCGSDKFVFTKKKKNTQDFPTRQNPNYKLTSLYMYLLFMLINK